MENKEQRLYVISGSSGVGKGTLIKAFLSKHPDFEFSVSCTTRKKREGEVEGVNYHFVTREEFETSVENDEFLEWAEFSDNFYGTKKDFVQNAFKAGKNVLLEIDTQGAFQIKKKMPEAVLIFISPPSYQDLEFRLRNRKTETEAAIEKRLAFVKLEMENSKYFDYMVINDVVDYAVQELERIIATHGVY